MTLKPLAAGTVERGPLELNDAFDRSAAYPAWQPFPAVYTAVDLEVAGGAVAAHEVAQRTAAGRDGIAQGGPDLDGQAIAAGATETACGCSRMDGCAKQALRGIDVAHAHNQISRQ